MKKPKLLRVTTVPLSLMVLLRGQLRYMNEHGFEVVGVSSAGWEAEVVEKEEGIRVEVVEMSRQITPLRDLRALWQFYRLCKKEKPDVVHSHTPKAGIIAMLGAKMAGVPMRLHTVAGLPLMEATGNKRRLLDFVEKMTYRAATKVYPNSRGLEDFILKHKLTTKEKVKVLANGSSNGIDTAHFHPESVSEEEKADLRKELKIEAGDFVFVFVGRLVGDKGINELVRAFTRLKTRTDRRVKLVLVGPEERELDPLEGEVDEMMHGGEAIAVVGFRQDVRPYFGISDALVFPSYREGFPNVVMQAGAMGLPAIVSDINGCNEIIIPNTNGLIVPPKDEATLEEAMKKLAEDGELYRRLQQNARRLITERYEQGVVWEAVRGEYLGRNRPFGFAQGSS